MEANSDFIAQLGNSFIGQVFLDNYDTVTSEITNANLAFRWLEPDTAVYESDVRIDRVNINVDANGSIISFSVG